MLAAAVVGENDVHLKRQLAHQCGTVSTPETDAGEGRNNGVRGKFEGVKKLEEA